MSAKTLPSIFRRCTVQLQIFSPVKPFLKKCLKTLKTLFCVREAVKFFCWISLPTCLTHTVKTKRISQGSLALPKLYTLLLTQNTELVPLTHSENILNVSRPHCMQAELEKVTITSHFGFVIEEISGRETARLS